MPTAFQFSSRAVYSERAHRSLCSARKRQKNARSLRAAYNEQTSQRYL